MTTPSPFTPDREKGMTQQTVGVNPDPPAERSASVASDPSPLPTDEATGAILGPYNGLNANWEC